MRECPYVLPDGQAQLREQGAVTEVRLFDGRIVWAATSLAAARALLADDRLSVDPDVGDIPKLSRVLALGRPERSRTMRTLLRTDPPQHLDQRRAMRAAFALKRTHTHRPALEAAADAALDRMTSREEPAAELLTAYIRPLVTTGAAELLGVAVDERPDIDTVLHNLNTAAAVTAYLTDRLARPDRPRRGLLGDLAAQVEAGVITQEEMVEYATVVLVAGVDATVSTIAVSVLALLTHPAELSRLLAGEVSWPGAVEELLRFVALTAGLVRVARADIEIAGVRIAAGDGVAVLNPLANRDPEVFERPDELDLGRRPRGHLTFGFGGHQCLGQHVARLEVEVALQRLLARIPGLRLDVALADLTPRRGTISGVGALPVAW